MRSLGWALIVAVALGAVACGDDDGGGGNGEAPVIERVAWTHAASCAPSTSTAVTVVTTVTDADTQAANLTFSGTSSGCQGSITSASATIMCPEVSPYPTTVRVTDPEGNMDSLQFSISPCEDGSAP